MTAEGLSGNVCVLNSAKFLENDRLYRKIHAEVPLDSVRYYKKFFSDQNGFKIDKIMDSVDPLPLASDLSPEYSKIIKKVPDL